MIKMTFDEYYAELERLKGLDNPKVTADYGLTAKDIAVMKADPVKYVYFCMYLITRDYYSEDSDEVKSFINSDALPQLKVTEELDNIINDALILVD